METFTLYFLQGVFYNTKCCNLVIQIFIEEKHLKGNECIYPLRVGEREVYEIRVDSTTNIIQSHILLRCIGSAHDCR